MTSRSRPVTGEPGRVAGLPSIEVDPVPVHDILRLREHGFGKPEERAYNHATEVLGVGDNLEWEVVTPQRLGIYAIWHDGYGVGLPRNSPIRPDRIIRRLSELLL
jgi:FMN phosphatase YigB (HAD superfamily)